MKKIISCLFSLTLFSGCTSNEITPQLEASKNENKQLKQELEQLTAEYKILEENYETLLFKQDNALNDSLYLIKIGNNYTLFSKRQYANELQLPPIAQRYEYNGIQSLQLNFDSKDAQQVNETLQIAENWALSEYTFHPENYLQKAIFLWYDIENKSI